MNYINGKLFTLVLIFVISLAAFAKQAQAQAQGTLVDQEPALEIIADFADRLCTDIPLEGSGNNIELSVKAKAELNGLIKKFADLGVEAAAKYGKSGYKGLLQQDLVKALQNNTNCKLKIWKDMKEKILSRDVPKSEPVSQTPPYAIYNNWDMPQLFFGTFSSTNGCLKKLITVQQKLGVANAKICTRLSQQMWCMSILEAGNNEVSWNCHNSRDACLETNELHEMEVQAGGKRVMSSCELLPWFEVME